MSHSFSFLVSRNTQLNKAAIWLSFLATFFLSSFLSTLSTFVAPLIGVSWRHLTTSFGVEFNDILAPLIGVQYTMFTRNIACSLDTFVVYYTSIF